MKKIFGLVLGMIMMASSVFAGEWITAKQYNEYSKASYNTDKSPINTLEDAKAYKTVFDTTIRNVETMIFSTSDFIFKTEMGSMLLDIIIDLGFTPTIIRFEDTTTAATIFLGEEYTVIVLEEK